MAAILSGSISKGPAVLVGEMSAMRQQDVHSPAFSCFRNNMIYKRMQNQNCQPRCHSNFRMSRNKGILYPLFLERHRCQIMHRVPPWHYVLVSLQATRHSFQKDFASGVFLAEYLPGAGGGGMTRLASLHPDRVEDSKRGGRLKNGWRLGVNCHQPPSRQLDRSTIKALEK